MHLNIASASWRPFCSGGDELNLKFAGNFFYDIWGITLLLKLAQNIDKQIEIYYNDAQ